MQKILDAARGEACAFGGPTCNHNPETVVACHSNYQEDGKGMGLKADDIYVMFACSSCHMFYDGGYTEMGWSPFTVQEMFHKALKRTWRRLIEEGVLQ